MVGGSANKELGDYRNKIIASIQNIPWGALGLKHRTCEQK